MSILVVKLKHKMDLTSHLKKAVAIANYSINNRKQLSSKYVKNIGLPSAISNQILRKYGRNIKCKTINESKIKLVVPAQAIKIENNVIKITPLQLNIINESKFDIKKINQIELDAIYAYISFEKIDCEMQKFTNFIGIDLNATSYCAVVAIPKTGKIIKLGKEAPHIRKKYKNLRKVFQRKKLIKKIKQIKGKESRKTRNINHTISKKIIEFAALNKCGIKLEKLTGIRKNLRTNKSFRYTLNSWSYYQLGNMIAYKALLKGIPVLHIHPAYTSQDCSKCGCRGKRNGKKFSCGYCKHSDHADVNAAFNIAKSSSIITSK